MSRSTAPARWPAVAALVLVAIVVAVACGGGSTSAAPTTAASVAAATTTPTAAPTPSPVPVDVGAVFVKTMTDPSFSASADISGSMTVGPITGVISGDAAFSAGNSSMTMIVDTEVFKQETATIQIDDQKWSMKAPGPWLEDSKPAAGSSGTSVGQMLQSLVKVTDLGVVTRNGRALHHLQFPGTNAISGALVGIDPATTKDAKFALDFYATDAGVPVVMSLTGSWTQVGDDAQLPATMTFDIAFADVGKPQTVTAPTDVWVVHTSKAMGYSMAHPEDWTVTSAKGEDTFAKDGQGYVYVATTAYTGSTAKFAADLKASYKKPFKGEPLSETATQLGGVPAVRLIYEFTNDSGQNVTVADDLASRDGTGWEVYLATGGGQSDIEIFDQFVATFAFTR